MEEGELLKEARVVYDPEFEGWDECLWARCWGGRHELDYEAMSEEEIDEWLTARLAEVRGAGEQGSGR